MIETTELEADELAHAWPILSAEERTEGFHLLARLDQETFFFGLSARDQSALLLALPPVERRLWIRLVAPDDAADIIQESPPQERQELLDLLDGPTRQEVIALLVYAEDDAGGLMSPRYARLRPEMSADEAIRYLRRQAIERVETIYYVYVLDPRQRLLGVVSFRELFAAPPERRVSEVMQADVVTVSEEMDQEEVARIIAEHDLLAIPVLDAEGRIKGVVTVDDIVDVFEEEATEDIQKIGGTEALGAPYLEIGLAGMLRKRVGWLLILFFAQMLTANVIGFYEGAIANVVVLTLFIPLIISSGGNSGSQATTLVIRAMSLGEIRLRDWWRVLRRELLTGLSLGAILAVFGILRVAVGESLFGGFGEFYLRIGMVVGFSLLGVVLLGTVAGSMLPLLLQRLGLDPASASAPFVATVVDVTGLVLYFSIASWILSGTLL